MKLKGEEGNVMSDERFLHPNKPDTVNDAVHCVRLFTKALGQLMIPNQEIEIELDKKFYLLVHEGQQLKVYLADRETEVT